MSLQGQGSRNQQQTNTNTRSGISFKNSEQGAKFKAALNYVFWNGMVTMRFHPLLEESKQSDFRKFDYDQYAQATVTVDRLATMAEYIDTKLVPALLAGEETNYGFPMSVSSNALMLLGTTKDDEGEVVPYVGLIPDINPETRKPIDFIAVQFEDNQVIQDYNIETGFFEKASEFPKGYVGLKLFSTLLKSSVTALTNAETHAMRTVQRSWHDRVAGALNINQGGNSGYNKGGNANSSIFNSPSSSNNQGTSSAKVNELPSDPSSEELDNLMKLN